MAYANVDTYSCAHRCLMEGDNMGVFMSIPSDADEHTHVGDCFCDKGPMQVANFDGTDMKSAAVGLCGNKLIRRLCT